VFDLGCRGAEQMNGGDDREWSLWRRVDSGGKREEVNLNAFNLKLRVTFN
jgi:hypothetical protein